MVPQLQVSDMMLTKVATLPFKKMEKFTNPDEEGVIFTEVR